MTYRFEILRPDDLLAIEFEARNLRLDTSKQSDPRLLVENPAQPAFLIVRFAAQSVAEKAYFETAANIDSNPAFNTYPPPPALPGGSDPLDPPGQVSRRMGGPSRLVFRLPQHLSSLSYRIDALLDWEKLELVLSSVALGQPSSPPLQPPGDLESALELPYRLLISPASVVAWAHSTKPVTHAGRTEIWHTRLASVVHAVTRRRGQSHLREASDSHPIPLRVVWSPDFSDHAPLPDPANPGPFLSTLSPRDRFQLVVLTSGTGGYYVPTVVVPFHTPLGRPVFPANVAEKVVPAAAPWTPQPIQASRLFLTALGGSLTSHGNWTPLPSYTATDGSTQSLDLSEWRHLATGGRDHYVKVVYDGYLYPFGHRASLVKVTERKVVPPDGGALTSPIAYLKQHMYVVVREHEKTYDPTRYAHRGREMPFFKRIRIRTLVTPDIDKPAYIPDGTAAPSAFWVDVGGSGFPFHVTVTDLAAREIDAFAEMIFVSVSEASIAAVQAEYIAKPDRRMCVVHGARVTYADPAIGDTRLRTTGLLFDTQILQPGPPYTEAPFLPLLSQAAVTVPVLEELIGLTTPVDIQYYNPYLNTGIDANAGVFATISGTPPSITFTADKGGGFATPNLVLTALSARKGIIAGSPDDAAAGLIDPSQFFGGVSIPGKIFGTVPLAQLIPVPMGGKASAARNAPEIRVRLVPHQNPLVAVTHLDWRPELTDYSEGPIKILFNQRSSASSLVLKAKIERQLAGGIPTSEISGELTSFQIELFGVIAINVDSINFKSKNGSKAIVKALLPSGHPISFEGPLAFVQTLADVLPPGIFGGLGPSIQLLPDHIRVTYTLGIPPISIGVFTLEHISIMVGVDLPYVDGKPAFEFAFAKRNRPFLLTVECLGGGGFVHLVVDADGVEMVEGALEFGGLFSIDFGIAGGGVHIMAGIYFMLSGQKSDLTGFVDIGGELSVLGIISISIDVNLSLSYEVSGSKQLIEGRATLTISISILFFSMSVSVSVERSFGNSAGDPHVDDLISEADWASYALGFA